MSALNQVDMKDNRISINGFDFSQKLALAVYKNLDKAIKEIDNYNHISIWKTLLNLTEQTSFKFVYNKFIGKETKIDKKKKKLNHNDANKSFENEKEFVKLAKIEF